MCISFQSINKKAFEAEMSSFYHLFNRFLAEKAKGEKLYVWMFCC